MNQDLKTGIQKLKEWSERFGFTNGQLGEIIKLFEKAKEYQEEEDKRSIVWSVNDFISQAEKRWDIVAFLPTASKYHHATCWQDVYDETKFQNALYEMIDRHDAEYGITWETINFYLDEYCLKK